MIIYKSIARLKYGEHFMFATGTTINVVTHKERNQIMYRNLMTGKIRRVKHFVDVCKEQQTCNVRFVRMLDELLNKYHEIRIEQDNGPW